NTQSALRFLMAVVARTGQPLNERDRTIRESLDHGLEGMLRAQYPNGAWPQVFNAQPQPDEDVLINQGNGASAQLLRPIKIPDELPLIDATAPDDWPRTWPGTYYRAYYTFNDRSIPDCILTMLVAWKQFGDERYLQS